MFRNFFLLSILVGLICFSNQSVLVSHEKSNHVDRPDQNQTSFEELPEDLRSLIKKTFYADTLNSYHIIESHQEFKAINKLQNLEATFTKEGAFVKGTRAQNPWNLSLNLKGFGWVDAAEPVKAGTLASDKNRVEIDRGHIKEWFINDQRGLEQGFTIDQPPVGAGTQLVLELSINSDWEALVSKDKRNITLTNGLGQSVDYAGLIAEDAQGRALETWFSSRKEKDQLICEIQVDVADAQFPILVDPVINETQKILPNDAVSGAQFGIQVGISGDTVIVGAPNTHDHNGVPTGAAYIFVRVGNVWTQQAKLLAADGAAFDSFGSVDISGDTAIVGAGGDDDNGNDSGSAYIFVRTGTVWVQQAKLLPNDGFDLDGFGSSVGISGETVIVGASGDDNNGSLSGSAYIFVRVGTLWTQQAMLLPNDGMQGDRFGQSVSISGETVVLGADFADDNGSRSGSAYIFVRNGTTWSQQAKLLPDDGEAEDLFGTSVDILDDTVVVGAFGDDAIPAFFSGAAYVFVRNGTTWTQQAKLLPDDAGTVSGFFGVSVSLSDETIVVGAPADNDNGFQSGSSYVFTRNGTTWSQQAKLLPTDGFTNDQFGLSVGLSNGASIIGALFDGDNGPFSGSAYALDVFCQKDLGFQLGNLRLSICGQDLTKANSTATLCVSDAAPSAQIFFALGPTNNPMPLLGGFVVPFPATILGPFLADSSGNFTLPLSGGDMNPFTFFLQAGVLNGAVFELSNALEVNAGS